MRITEYVEDESFSRDEYIPDEHEPTTLEVRRMREEMKNEVAIRETPVDINMFGIYGHFNILSLLVVVASILLGLQGWWMMQGHDRLRNSVEEMRDDRVEPVGPGLELIRDQNDEILEILHNEQEMISDLSDEVARLKKESKQMKETLERLKTSNKKMLEKILESVDEPVVVVKKRNLE